MELVPFRQAAQLIRNCPHCTELKFHSLLRKGLSLAPLLRHIIHFLSSHHVAKILSIWKTYVFQITVFHSCYGLHLY